MSNHYSIKDKATSGSGSFWPTRLLFLGGGFTALLVVLPRVPLVPQELRVHLFVSDFKTWMNRTNQILFGTRGEENRSKSRNYPFGGSVAVLAGLLDSVLVGLVRLVVSCVVLRLSHL